MNPFGLIKCLFVGHKVNTDETMTPSMIDKRNWLCKCHRCGLYEMHDGAISGKTITVSRRRAERTAMYFEAEALRLKRLLYGGDDT